MPRINGYEAEGTMLRGESLLHNLIVQIEDLRALLWWMRVNEDLSVDAEKRITEALSDP